MPSREMFVSVDIEADGQIPGVYSMLSLGAVVVGQQDDPDHGFYATVQPLPDADSDARALAVSGLDRDDLARSGMSPKDAMHNLDLWLHAEGQRHFPADVRVRPVMVGFNAAFDWQFVNYYFRAFGGPEAINPFGINCLDIKSMAFGTLFLDRWTATTKSNLPRMILSNRPHTHNALDDAREQADMFAKLCRFIPAPAVDPDDLARTFMVGVNEHLLNHHHMPPEEMVHFDDMAGAIRCSTIAGAVAVFQSAMLRLHDRRKAAQTTRSTDA